MIELAMLGEYLRDAAFRNAVCDCFLYVQVAYERSPSPAHVRYIYEQLPESSKLRKLVIHRYRWAVDASYLRRERKNFPPDFLCDLAIEFAKTNDPSCLGFYAPTLEDKRRYHDRNVEVPRTHRRL